MSLNYNIIIILAGIDIALLILFIRVLSFPWIDFFINRLRKLEARNASKQNL